MTHQFSSQLARDLFSLATETMQGALRGANQNVPPFVPDEQWDRWCDARESERPCTLPNAPQADIDDEMGRLASRRFVGTPKEL